MAKKTTSSNNLLFWIVGLCAFVSFVAKGIIWILSWFSITGGIVAQIGSLADLVLMIATFFAGLIWILSLSVKKNTRTALLIIYLVFAIMSICGLYVHFKIM